MAWNPLEHLKPVPYKKQYRPAKLAKKLSCPYAIIGAHAMISHFPERETFSLDILIETHYKQEAVANLKKHSKHYDQFDETHNFFILKRTKQYLCLINSEESWTQLAISESQGNLINNEPTLPFHWLILSKIWYGSRQDFLDCARLIVRATEGQIDQTKEVLSKHYPEALPELRKLYQVGQQELKHAPAYTNQPNVFSAWHKMNAEVDTEE